MVMPRKLELLPCHTINHIESVYRWHKADIPTGSTDVRYWE